MKTNKELCEEIILEAIKIENHNSAKDYIYEQLQEISKNKTMSELDLFIYCNTEYMKRLGINYEFRGPTSIGSGDGD